MWTRVKTYFERAIGCILYSILNYELSSVTRLVVARIVCDRRRRGQRISILVPSHVRLSIDVAVGLVIRLICMGPVG